MYGNHFTFEELTSTSTGLYNIPVDDSNLAGLWNTLNYIREEFGHPIIVIWHLSRTQVIRNLEYQITNNGEYVLNKRGRLSRNSQPPNPNEESEGTFSTPTFDTPS